MTPTEARAALARVRADARRHFADPVGFAERVRELEAEGLDRSDAQAAAEAERMSGELGRWLEALQREARK